MDQVKRILCLGNQTQDSMHQAGLWSKTFLLPDPILLTGPCMPHVGTCVPDLGSITIDDIWIVSSQADLIIMLDQPVSSYDHISTYNHYMFMCRYMQHFRPVMISAQDRPLTWLQPKTNQDALPDIITRNIHNLDLAIKLNTVNNIDTFKNQLNNLVNELQQRNCRWVFYRAGSHEDLHSEATMVLLEHPEFVLLNPGVFFGDVQANIVCRVYNHWINLYLKKTHG